MAKPLETYCTGPPEDFQRPYILEALDLQHILLPPKPPFFPLMPFPGANIDACPYPTRSSYSPGASPAPTVVHSNQQMYAPHSPSLLFPPKRKKKTHMPSCHLHHTRHEAITFGGNGGFCLRDDCLYPSIRLVDLLDLLDCARQRPINPQKVPCCGKARQIVRSMARKTIVRITCLSANTPAVPGRDIFVRSIAPPSVRFHSVTRP